MSNKSGGRGTARNLERVYDTKSHGIGHQKVLDLVRRLGTEGAIRQLEALGLSPAGPPGLNQGEDPHGADLP